MANVDDVAAYILELAGGMSEDKLQKLVYYCQAWHLTWEEQPLFNDAIEAWASGPVVPALHNKIVEQYHSPKAKTKRMFLK